jgi:long-chain acyl-CoA synthetase
VPRALRFTSGQLLADTAQITATMGISTGDLNYALIPLGHSYGLGNLTLPLLAKGIPLVCGASPLPHSIATDFEQWKPTVFPGVPAMWRALSTAEIALKSLRLAISAGAPLGSPIAREFHARHGIHLHNFYGSSETGGIAYDKTGRSTLTGGVGRAVRGVELKKISTSQLEVSSSAVFTLKNRRRRRGRLGVWRMSDLVEINPQGELTLLGRRGQTVKVAGRRVNLSEVVTRLRAIPGVTDAWVGLGSQSDPTLGAVIATSLGAGDLRTALHPDTAPWKIPKRWVIVNALPLTTRGKMDTRMMQNMIGR